MHSADEWEELPIPEIVRRRKLGKQVAFRADVAFGEPDIYEAAELQDSGYPFPDWNARITAKCYAPIGHARIVDDKAGTSSTAKYWMQLHWWRVCRLTQTCGGCKIYYDLHKAIAPKFPDEETMPR